MATGALGDDKIFKKIVPDSTKGDEVKLTATLGTGIKETTSLRCSVEVGKDDEKATDTKLIYVQKIRLGYQSVNYDRYQKLIMDDTLKVSVFGDDAYLLTTTGSKCQLKPKTGAGTDKDFTSSKSVEVAVGTANVGNDNTVSCTLKFVTKKGATAEDYTLSDAAKTFTVVDKCGDAQIYDGSKCVACSDNSYRHKDSTQFDSCRKCAPGTEPNGDRDNCEVCPDGKYSTSTATCTACSAGKEGKKGFCEPCQIGKFKASADAAMCTGCASGTYSSTIGSTQCSACPAGSYSSSTASSKCTLCEAGKYQGSEGQTSCKACDAGRISTEGSSQCTICPAGTKEVDRKRCTPCDAGQRSDAGSSQCTDCTQGKFSSVIGSPSCTECSSGSIAAAVKSSKCEACPAGKIANSAKTECETCKAGTYSATPGSTTCSPCPKGTYSGDGASSCTPCDKGQYSNAEGRDQCESCPAGEYSAIKGSITCLKCQGDVSVTTNTCTECKAGQKFEGGACKDCGEGEVSEESSSSCIPCPPGTRAHKDSNTCIACEPGEHQPAFAQTSCIPCDPERGQYQTEKGSTYCKTTQPGYKLDGGDNTKEEVICPKNTYSTGGTKKCTDCKAASSEYADAEGSTSCKICEGKVVDGDCQALVVYCKVEKITLKGVGDEEFTFKKISSGNTDSVPCKKNDDKEKEKNAGTITRKCRKDPSTKTAYWEPADASQCASIHTEEVNKAADALKDVNLTDKKATEDAVKSLSETATKAAEMAPKDLGNIATSLETFTKNLESQQEDVKMEPAEAEGLVNTVGSVAGAGEAKLASVTETEKTAMVKSVTIVATRLKDNKPIETDTIAMQKIETAKKDEKIALPKPKKDKLSAPSLTMKKTATKDNGDEVAPSVSVFDMETAQAIFPKPTASSSDTANSTDSGSSTSKNITYQIDSSIVSLEFAGTTTLDIEIEIPVDTSSDAGKQSNYELTRTCKFYDDKASEWSSKGCKTKEGSKVSDAEMSYVCACNHNTSFAIILSQAEIADTIQSTVSTVLNIINIVFLGITFLCIAPFKQFRTRRLIQIQTQLCFALFVGHIAFIILGTATASDKACLPGVIIVQYLFLVAVAWSVCASVTLYEKIVNALKSFGKQDKHYFVKCLAGCWVAPLFMVMSAYVTSITMDKGTMPYVTATGELDDEKTETCWVASPWKWVGFIIPVYLCLGVNVVLFIMIARIIIRAGKSGSSTGHAREVKAIMSIATTVCLPWLVALLMTGPKTMAQIFQWIFIIVTASQGPTMFVCFVIFQEDVLTNLFKLFGQEPPQALLPAKSSKSTKSAASEISTIKPTTAAVKKEEKSDIVQVKNPEYNNPVQQSAPSEENIYSKVDEEAPAAQEDTISRGSHSSKHLYESTSFTQHGEKEDSIIPVPAVEQGETYENPAAGEIDIANNSYPHVPQLV